MGVALAASLGACGDDDTGGNKTDVPLFDSDGGFPDVATDVIADTTVTTPDVADTRDSSPPDLIPDLDAPTVVSTSPANGAENVALPLTVTITFSEAVYAPTVATASIKFFDWLDREIPGTVTLGADGKTVTYKPTQNTQQLASQYKIRVVGNIISDLAGNRIANNLDFKFTTASYPSQDAYHALAAKYAPTVHSAVKGDLNAQMQIPTKLDGDGDWNLANNRQWITTGATQIIPAVYYAVTESRTHWFIHYVFYWPYIKLEAPDPVSLSHTNGSSGALVVIEKARGEVAERPVAAYTYWREQVREENYAFATTESGLVPGDSSAGSWSFKAKLDQATLFPDGRLQIFITPAFHQTCLVGWNEGGVAPPCRWGSEQQNLDTLVFAYVDGTPTPVVKKTNQWPSDMSDVDGTPESFSYALIPAWSSMWTRRFSMGDTALFADGAIYTYNPDAARPGNNLQLTSRFVETVGADLSSFGRPFWAWEWDPSSSGANDLIDDITQGQITLDPARYVWERHHRVSSANSLVEYNAETGAGWSQDYCFNGFVNVDVRSTDPKCTTAE